ncbi:hypothetical protein BU24DRAFT_359548 [Aaosphaeria arxii CBS 175.79]|uniref:Uncharacterized protein n=1 Tax=Aaosphaeria arxii CBS 175.79 TaxID=1450172 RepID=A0A6A5X768_9PLEO|nr:uncharacterized protein BU24DRAFT_359548 [Aaosphaeria arxii CBS 175.79]KAF2008736.1 hypothetical protein BU24DRAFT_359548 [Aaosphaeria arxii CBS 175.79]
MPKWVLCFLKSHRQLITKLGKIYLHVRTLQRHLQQATDHEAMHLWATRHELEESNDSPDDRLVLVKTVPGGVGNGRWTSGGYLATLGIYHELHCLRRIYWHFYPDVYFVNMTSNAKEEERAHARHCIDTVRQSLMCSPNLGLYSFKWMGDNVKPALKTGARRTCVKLDPLHEWANSRATGWNPLVWKPKNITK